MASQVIAQPYQTDHLILLIGTNPVPNYVAAQLLCPRGKLYLLHTTGTKDVAENLAFIFGLDRCPPENLFSLGEAESDPQQVYETIQKILTVIPVAETPGLHYTGGTKVMSVHAYRAALTMKKPVICSYLDAHTLEIVITQSNTSDGVWRFYVGDKVKIGMADLLKLHNLSLKQAPKKRSRLKMDGDRLEQLYQALADIHLVHRQEWRDWCNVNLRRTKEAREMVIEDWQAQAGDSKLWMWQEITDKGDKWKSEGKLKRVELTDAPNLRKARQIFMEQFPNLSEYNLVNLGQLCGFPKRDDMIDFAKWFDGEWLEDYTLWALQQLVSEDYNLVEPGMDYKIQNPEFQFDVAVTRGYQLFAFSCTTSDDKKICKSKLFEAYIRAQQMGGDEARTALICCYEDIGKLEGEMIREFNAKDKIKVFGYKDLPKLKDRLRAWFDQVEGSQRRKR